MKNEKYIRQIALPQIGEIGQQKLRNASVLIVGAGGLGNAVLPYLASSGIGKIGIIDGDIISESNLHRQILFFPEDIGLSKSEVAKNRLEKQFPEIELDFFNEYLDGKNALKIFANYDLIIDATDSIQARYLINDASILTQKAFVHAAIYRFQFQIATFNFEGSGTYRCLHPNKPTHVQSCAEAGVMPTTVAMAGIYQANEVLKYFLNIGELLINKVLLIDTLTNKQHIFKYKKRELETVTAEYFDENYLEDVKIISFKDASKLKGLFLDVRNRDEEPKLDFENYYQIPLSELSEKLSQIPKEMPIFIFCQSGKRSMIAAEIIGEKLTQEIFCLNENAPEIAHEKK